MRGAFLSYPHQHEQHLILSPKPALHLLSPFKNMIPTLPTLNLRSSLIPLSLVPDPRHIYTSKIGVFSQKRFLFYHTRDLGSIPDLGRSPGEENGYPLQYSCLENPMDRGTWWATVYRVAKSWTWLSD